MVLPIPKLRQSLTGLCRPRRGLFGQVVMQVQVRIDKHPDWGRTPAMPILQHIRQNGTREQLAAEQARFDADSRLYLADPLGPIERTWYEWRDARMSDFVLKTPQATALSLEQ